MLILLLFFWLFVALFIAVKLSSRGTAFYAHRRIGRAGKPFVCYKFRTMYADADLRLKQILEQSDAARNEWQTSRKLRNDPRITPLGRLLRKSSLDELPQFWNVLKGDLSVVGPRPVVYEEVIDLFAEKAQKILSIRPGVTGLWQVSGRNNLAYVERVRLDENYVDNHSLWIDVKLIARTIPSMLFARGAY
jgi:undecaprenyl-phosphate galactose phosphotransferase